MSKTTAQFQQTAHQLERAINGVLPAREQQFVTSRWLDQLLWMDQQAERMQVRYYTLRLITIIGGVAAPALFSLRSSLAHGAAVVLSLIVGISAAVEEFFHYGERWRHYRATAEELKAEGWRFFELSDIYDAWFRKYRDATADPAEPHQVYPYFVQRVEGIIGREVHSFLSRIADEREESKSPRQDGNERPSAERGTRNKDPGTG